MFGRSVPACRRLCLSMISRSLSLAFALWSAFWIVCLLFRARACDSAGVRPPCGVGLCFRQEWNKERLREEWSGVVDREGTSGLQRMRDDLMRDMLIRVAVGATAAKSRASCVYAKKKSTLSSTAIQHHHPHAPHLRLYKIHAPPSPSVSY